MDCWQIRLQISMVLTASPLLLYTTTYRLSLQAFCVHNIFYSCDAALIYTEESVAIQTMNAYTNNNLLNLLVQYQAWMFSYKRV